MAARIQYQIVVSFNKGQCANPLGVKNLVYYKAGNVTKNDQVSFFKKSIKIAAERKDFYTGIDILYKTTISIHHTVERAIMLYYANCTNFPKINKISVSVTCPNAANNYTFETNRTNTPQIFKFAINREPDYVVSPSANWYGLDDKGNALRISLSYWLEAISSSVPQIKFERAWTAFNTLYSYYGQKKQEFENHAYIKQQILANQAHFNQSVTISHSMTSTMIRSYRLKKWVKTQLDRKSFGLLESIMTHIQDDRLRQVFKGVFNSGDITSRFTHPTNADTNTQRQTTLTNIQTALAVPGGVDDIEVTFFMCITYAYFLRNRRFHGGSENSYCKISPTAEDKEFESISERLVTLVKELYEAENVLVVNPNP